MGTVDGYFRRVADVGLHMVPASKNEVSMTVQIPKHPFIYGVSICFGLLCVAILHDLMNSIMKGVRE